MKTNMISWQLTAIIATLLTLVSCRQTEPQKTSRGNVLVETTIKNPDGMSGSSYIQLLPQLSGTLSLDGAIQVGFASTITVSGKEIYVFPEFGNKGAQTIDKYMHSEEGLQKVGELQAMPGAYPVNLTRIAPDKAYISLYSLGRVLVINPQTMQKIKEIDLKKYAHSDTSAEPSCAVLRDGLCYLTLDQIGENWMPYEDYRQVDVAIINPQTDEVIKVISETKSGLCFPTRPLFQDMIFTDEAGDIYIACTGYFGYNPQYLKSGWVCIPKGKQEFDSSKGWDISQTIIEGTNYKPATIYNSVYLGNGKVAAYVGILELNGENPYTSRNSMAVVMDLKTKTISRIKGIPETDGHSVAITKHNGEVYFSSYGVNDAGIFIYEPVTHSGRRVLAATGNIGFMHIF